jgi:hypothetical protein
MILNQNNIDNFTQIKKTVSMGKANVFSFVIMGPAVIILCILYAYNWKTIFYLSISDCIIFIVGAILLAISHEFIHGFVFHFFCIEKWKSIKFGILTEYLTIYCHCKEAITLSQYRIGTMMPLIFTGIIPYIIALHFGNFILMLLSLMMILGAGGDVIIILLCIREKGKTLVIDDEKECGCTLYMAKTIKEEQS